MFVIYILVGLVFSCFTCFNKEVKQEINQFTKDENKVEEAMAYIMLACFFCVFLLAWPLLIIAGIFYWLYKE